MYGRPGTTFIDPGVSSNIGRPGSILQRERWVTPTVTIEPPTAQNIATGLEVPMTSTAEAIRSYISNELAPGSEIDEETSLITSEIIDSMGVLTLIGFLEEEFGVEISSDDVDLTHFESVVGIARLVEERRDRT